MSYPENPLLDNPQLKARALQYLQGVGDILDASADMVLLDPIKWLAKLLSFFIRDEGAAPIPSKDGICSLADVKIHLLEHAEVLVDVLSRIGICFKLDDQQLMFPCLRPSEHKEVTAEWKSTCEQFTSSLETVQF